MTRNAAIICLLTALFLAAGPLAAQTAKLSIVVHDTTQAPLTLATVDVTPDGGSTTSAKVDQSGLATFDVPTAVRFMAVVKAPGYKNFSFARTINAKSSFGAAVCIMCVPRMGNSRVSEWREGSSNPAEDPAKDSARFNFYVKYYKGSLPIAGATIALTKTDGAEFRTLTTDAKGYATVLVTEGLKLNIKVSAAGYVDYLSVLQPGLKASTRNVNVRLRKQ